MRCSACNEHIGIHEAIRAGDVFDLDIRRVRVSGMPASAKVCRDRRGRIAVRNVETNRLSYVPERLLRGNPKVQSGATLNESDASDGTQQQRSVAVDPVAPRTVNGPTRDPYPSSEEVDAAVIVSLRAQLEVAEASLREAQAQVKIAEEELAQWRTWGVIEIAVRNPNVSSYMDHWESRATKAEAQLQTAEQEIEAFNRNDHDREGAAMVWADLYRAEKACNTALLAARDRLVEQMQAVHANDWGESGDGLVQLVRKWADALSTLGDQP